MVIDSSVLISILEKEKGYQSLINDLANLSNSHLSVTSYVETSIVMYHRRGPGGIEKLDELIDSFSITLHDFDKEQADKAIRAYQIYGKGHHKAKLNLGDCFSYALAKKLGTKLLYKGNDFKETDLA